MCTAITYKSKNSYFGRTLDYEISYDEEIVITPRKYAFPFGKTNYAILGISHVAQNHPLYYDAMNEKGLAMAGLNFVGNAKFNPKKENKDNIAPHDFIPWILSQCETVKDAKKLLATINLENRAFNEELPIAELHWIIADKNESITVESVKDGLKIYKNHIGVLTNNPPFDIQLFNLNNYMSLSANAPKNTFDKNLKFDKYSRGLGALGLPGDLSSMSRFVRAAFVKNNSITESSEVESINQFFHILASVENQKGCCIVEKGKYNITIYTSCYNLNENIFYYTTYENHQISCLNMHNENLESTVLVRYPIIQKESINYLN